MDLSSSHNTNKNSKRGCLYDDFKLSGDWFDFSINLKASWLFEKL
jgi:hypothetical protein